MHTETKPDAITREIIVNAPISRVWKAITDKDEMKQWYFNLPDFKPEVGFEFSFSAGEEGKVSYLHLCKVADVIPGQKLSYSWRYDGYAGDSLVTFDLSGEGSKTRVKLTHEGLESFPQTNPDLQRKNFVAGWDEIIGNSLVNYLENGN